MNFISSIEILENKEWGVFLNCSDLDAADQFEDFLTEDCFVLFKIKPDKNMVSFFFGQAGSVTKVTELCERFVTVLKDKGFGRPV